MSLTLAAVVVTAVISCGDLVVNIWSGCLKGKLEVRVGTAHISHKDTEAELLEVIANQSRRMSAPN